MQKAHKALQAGQYFRSLQRSIVPSIEIRVHTQLILARDNGCTNARYFLWRSYGHELFKNVNLSRCKRRTKPYGPDNISVPCSAGCTNARCILSRSYGHEEFKNVNPFALQKVHKALRAGHYLRSLQRSIMPSMEIRVHSTLILARYKGCTNARYLLSRSYGHDELKNVNPF